jgi:type II secretory pathway component GspD/PulD (secretin)
MECNRRGDYEQAAVLYQQAQEGRADLSPTEQQDLARGMQSNSAAVQARREGAQQLAEAEKALRAGRAAEAAELLKKVMANQYVTAADKQKAQALRNQAQPRMAGTPTGTGPNNGPPTITLARTKLQQARTMLSQANLDAAEQLANEAQALNAVYTPGEDTPAKVMTEIGKARTDPKVLLTAARKALERGDLDKAEQLAQLSSQADSSWNMHLWGDSPNAVLKDVQAARAKGVTQKPAEANAAGKFGTRSVFSTSGKQDPSTAPTPPAVDPAKDKAEVAKSTEAAKQLLQQARKALQEGNVAQATQLTSRARAMKPALEWWDDTPEKVQADIDRMSKGMPTATVAATPNKEQPTRPQDANAKKPLPPATEKEDARTLLKQGREMYNAGKFDEAGQLAQRARTAAARGHGGSEGWGLWGLFKDSPDKLLQDVEKAKLQHDQEESVKVMAEARKLYEQGDLDGASRAAYKAQKLHGTYSIWDMGDRPAGLLAQVETARSKNRKKGETAPGSRTDDGDRMAHNGERSAPANQSASPAPQGPARRQAEQLLAECRQLQREGKLAEARQKALQAQQVRAVFSPNEDSPEAALLQLSSLCFKRVDALVQEAADYQQTAGGDPRAMQKVEDNLVQARQLAVSFGQDTTVVDARLAMVRQQRSNAPAGEVRVAGGEVPANAAAGMAMLTQAREALRRGETQNARKLAEDVFNGSYGLQDEASKVMRSVDAEEFGQQRLAANRTYEAGMAAFRRGDHAQASVILRSVNVRLLEEDKQAHLKNIFAMPEMMPNHIAQASGAEPGAVTPLPAAPVPAAPVPSGAGVAHATDASPEQDLLKTTQAMQDIKFQQLRQQGLEAQREAAERFKTGDTARALTVLQDYVAELSTVQLDSDRVALLRRPVESRLMQFKTLKAQRDWETANLQNENSVKDSHAQRELVEENKKKKVAELMQAYNSFYKDGKYKEAEMYAMAAHEMDPDNSAAAAGATIAKIQRRQVEYQTIKDKKEKLVLESLNDADDPGDYVNSGEPLHVDPERAKMANKRTDLSKGVLIPTKTDVEKEIEHKLTTPVTMSFQDAPLDQVLDDIRAWHSINIVPDLPALDAEGISLKRQVTIKLDNVALKSALNLLLHQVHLTYQIKDNVLQITTDAQARGKMVPVTYQVADLVIPIPNYNTPSLDEPIRGPNATNPPAVLPGGGGTPYNGPFSLPNGSQPASVTSSMGGSSPWASSAPSTASQAAPKNTVPTQEDALIKLITSTIAPQSWDSMGGHGHIDYFPMGMTLVINQTPDIQEQIADLLAALRRLQDQEVSIEVRFITVAEGFFERIGLDFNVNIRTGSDRSSAATQLVTGQFAPAGFINDFAPDKFISGLTPAGTFTSDLNIPVKASSFAMAVPPFGGFPAIPGGNGGIDLGLAFLSDIQVFMFMEAAQGDQRTNVMQAPKLTLFNGQTSTIAARDQQFFVTSVTVIQQGGQFAFVPQNTDFVTAGATMAVQAVISADRRFVRLNLAPTLTNLASAVVPLFPIVTPIIPQFEGGFNGQPVLFTQFVQQPVFSTITVATSVTVPDGGTVLIGGLKRLSEGRNEFGPPVLSKIPYINRLFKNVGYGRETESLMIMVTPRIIINEEEEERQTGVSVRGGP